MRIEKKNPAIFQLTLSAFELGSLISSARWAAEGAKGELTVEAKEQLKRLLENYDHAISRLNENKMQEETQT